MRDSHLTSVAPSTRARWQRQSHHFTRSLAELAQTRYFLPRAVTRRGVFTNATLCCPERTATHANSVHAKERCVPGAWLRAYICRSVWHGFGLQWGHFGRGYEITLAVLCSSELFTPSRKRIYAMLTGFHSADVRYPFSIRVLDLPSRFCNSASALCDPPTFAESIRDTRPASAITRLHSPLPIYLCCCCALLSLL